MKVRLIPPRGYRYSSTQKLNLEQDSCLDKHPVFNQDNNSKQIIYCVTAIWSNSSKQNSSLNVFRHSLYRSWFWKKHIIANLTFHSNISNISNAQIYDHIYKIHGCSLARRLSVSACTQRKYHLLPWSFDRAKRGGIKLELTRRGD